MGIMFLLKLRINVVIWNILFTNKHPMVSKMTSCIYDIALLRIIRFARIGKKPAAVISDPIPLLFHK
jgi:hypothetical protein